MGCSDNESDRPTCMGPAVLSSHYEITEPYLSVLFSLQSILLQFSKHFEPVLGPVCVNISSQNTTSFCWYVCMNQRSCDLSYHTLLYLYMFLLCRMFSSTMDVKPNEHGEYEVAKGVSASIFRAIMVREVMCLHWMCALSIVFSLFLGILQTWCSYLPCIWVYSRDERGMWLPHDTIRWKNNQN